MTQVDELGSFGGGCGAARRKSKISTTNRLDQVACGGARIAQPAKRTRAVMQLMYSVAENGTKMQHATRQVLIKRSPLKFSQGWKFHVVGSCPFPGRRTRNASDCLRLLPDLSLSSKHAVDPN